MIRNDRERVLSELSRAPTTGVSRGELAILMLDVEDDDVTKTLDALMQSGQILTSRRNGLVRYHPIAGA